MSYATTHGGHDAEWLLQNEKALNDRLLQAARSGRLPVSKPHVSSIGAVSEITPWEAEMAARFVHRVVKSEAAGEVLAMLGLEAS